MIIDPINHMICTKDGCEESSHIHKRLIKEDRERSWYLVKSFMTSVGLKAHITQCVWNRDLMPLSLHDHLCGYVELPEKMGRNFYDNQDGIEVHGGVTHQGVIGIVSPATLVGFDLGHVGDEHIANPLAYAEKECESLARQLREQGV